MDLIGRIVDVPAHVFGIDVPDMYYRGRIKKVETKQKGAMIVHFKEDKTEYWLPVEDLRMWLNEMEGRDPASGTVGPKTDLFAANVLLQLSDCAKRKLLENMERGSGEDRRMLPISGIECLTDRMQDFF